MSLELALQQNTEAVNRLAAILSGGLAGAVTLPGAPEAKPVKATKKAEPKPDPVKEVLAVAEEKTPAPEAKPAAALTFQQVSDKVMAVAKGKGSATARAILEGFGVSTLPKLTDKAKWPELVAKCDEALAA